MSAIQLAGSVKGRKAARHATSDWMEMEKERGISVTTSVMQFEHKDCITNLLDTPGHEDFSEDTYRTLTAVDSALMVIDVAKGVETQTEKFVEVCRMRNTPIIVFINKLDREGKDAFDLLDEIEQKLKLKVCPLSWPVGMGQQFKGVYDMYVQKLALFPPHRKQEAEDRAAAAQHYEERTGPHRTCRPGLLGPGRRVAGTAAGGGIRSTGLLTLLAALRRGDPEAGKGLSELLLNQ